MVLQSSLFSHLFLSVSAYIHSNCIRSFLSLRFPCNKWSLAHTTPNTYLTPVLCIYISFLITQPPLLIGFAACCPQTSLDFLLLPSVSAPVLLRLAKSHKGRLAVHSGLHRTPESDMQGISSEGTVMKNRQETIQKEIFTRGSQSSKHSLQNLQHR